MLNVYVKTESIISSLFLLGFDKVDPYLVAMLSGAIYTQKRDVSFYAVEIKGEKHSCILKEAHSDELSPVFNKYFEFNGTYSIKDGYTLDSKIKINLFYGEYSLRDYLNSTNNIALAAYITNYIDLESIMDKKVKAIGFDKIKGVSHLFSNKEKEYIYANYGIMLDEQPITYQKKLSN